MKKIFLLIPGFLFLFSCSPKKGLREQSLGTSTALVLDSLVCKELSENAIGLGSRDDEVLTLVYLGSKESGILKKWISGVDLFSETTKRISLGHRMDLPKNWADTTYLIVVLVEQDSYLTTDSISSIINSNISFTTLPKINKVVLQEALGDDDLLDAKAISLKKIPNNKNTKTKLSGIHLFDEYEYWLYWGLE